MKKTLSVSIIVANYNNGKYLSEFIKSIDSSSVKPYELIIIDDGSTDNSLEVLDNFVELSYLKIIKFVKNKGFAQALNAGIKTATGKYIMRADPDDILLPERIKTQFDFMEINPNVDVLGGNVIYFLDETGHEINISNFPILHKKIKNTYRKGEHGLQHPTAFVKSKIMKKFQYIPDVFPSEDYEIFSQMIKSGYIFANIKTPIYKMRVHRKSSTSNTTLKSIERTFAFRDEIFGTVSCNLEIKFYYNYIRFYRKYQLSKNIIIAHIYLAIAIFCYPSKLLKRLK